VSESEHHPQLPVNWIEMRLSEIADFRNGINFASSQKGKKGFLTIDVLNMYSNSIHPKTDNLYRVDLKSREEQFLRNGDILFVRSSVKREGVGWASLFKEIGEPVTFVSFIIRARLHFEIALPEFLIYYLRMSSVREKIVSSSSQVVITNISQGALGKISMPIPPLSEQRRIVSKVEELFSFLDAGVASLRKVQAQLKRYRQAVLKYAFEGKLAREKQELCHNQELGLEVPCGWNMKTAKELFYIKGRIGWRGLKKSHFAETGPYLITGVDFQNGAIDWNDCYHIPTDKYLESPEIFVQEDDVLLTKDGTIGKLAYVDNVPNGQASINAHILLIRSIEKTTILPRFTYYALQAPNFLSFVERRKIGTTRPALTQRAFEEFPFYYPQLEEQEEIIGNIERFLSAADDLSKTLKQDLSQAQRMRQSILKRAFEGRLVSQDPNDEPAEKLLERIKAERFNNRKPKSDNQVELSRYVK
jgi:type I restriction enzyme S subunit